VKSKLNINKAVSDTFFTNADRREITVAFEDTKKPLVEADHHKVNSMAMKYNVKVSVILHLIYVQKE
jgi:hypothetical protein